MQSFNLFFVELRQPEIKISRRREKDNECKRTHYTHVDYCRFTTPLAGVNLEIPHQRSLLGTRRKEKFTKYKKGRLALGGH